MIVAEPILRKTTARRLVEEGLIGAGKAAGILNMSPRTVSRMMLDGSRAKDGTRVKLESVRRGSRLATSRAAIERFLERLSGNSESAPIETVTDRERESQRLDKLLKDRFGL